MGSRAGIIVDPVTRVSILVLPRLSIPLPRVSILLSSVSILFPRVSTLAFQSYLLGSEGFNSTLKNKITETTLLLETGPFWIVSIPRSGGWEVPGGTVRSALLGSSKCPVGQFEVPAWAVRSARWGSSPDLLCLQTGHLLCLQTRNL